MCCQFILRNIMTILIILGVATGFGLGILLRTINKRAYTPRETSYVNFIGDMFMSMLKALILPLIVTSLIPAIGGLDLRVSGSIGRRGIIYYLGTTLIAVVQGICWVSLIKPGGRGFDGKPNEPIKSRTSTTEDSLLDLARNLFPPNIILACLKQYHTVLIPPPTPSPSTNDTNVVENDDVYKWDVGGEFKEGINVLGIVVLSTVVGVAISVSREEGSDVLNIFKQTNYIMMLVTGWVIWLSPIGIIFLIAAKLVSLDSLSNFFDVVGLFCATVLTGILCHALIVLPLIYFIFTQKNPYKFLFNMGAALATAFGTSSSLATLPFTLECLEKRNNIDPRVTRFTVPIGATINMDGTALYEAVAAIFIAQVRGVHLTFGKILTISLTATGASIGAAGIPQVGMITTIMVLDSIGLPVQDVSLIIAVDWLLDRFRTAANVLGDSFGAGVVEHLSRNELSSLPPI